MSAPVDFPMPKFRKGDKVWYAWTDVRSASHPCPDCLGSRKWVCTSPAGHSMEMSCPRCTYRHSDRLSLEYAQHSFGVRELTVGSVKIDTSERYEHPVSYMCVETGVGSGSIYYENRLYASREDAVAVQEALAAERQRVADATPEAMTRLDYSTRSYFSALEKEAETNALEKIRRTLVFEHAPGEPTAGIWCIEQGYDEHTFDIKVRTADNPYGVTVCTVSGSDESSFRPPAADAIHNAKLIVDAANARGGSQS